MFSASVLAVHGKIRERLVGVVLVGELFGGDAEVGEVLGGPPVAEGSGGVEGAALGVKGVADLVSDDGTDSAVVGRGGSVGVKERWLQDGGGEVERVLQREIDGVDGLRRHGPFLLAHCLAQAV